MINVILLFFIFLFLCFTGPHDDDSENKAVDVLTASNTVGFHLSSVPTLKSSSGEGEPSHGMCLTNFI